MVDQSLCQFDCEGHSDENNSVPPSQKLARHLVGVLLIVLVACIWVAASQLIEGIFQEGSFNKPYFLTYFNTCGFALWLLVAAFRRRLRHQLSHPLSISDPSVEPQPVIQRGVWVYLRIAASVAPGWMLANYLFNLSLDYTSVASNSVLSTTSNLWTLLFSACFLQERADPIKLISIVATVSGAALVATADTGSKHGSESGGGSIWGDLLALLAACAYGGYSVLLKVCMPDSAEGLSVLIVFGFVGLLVLLCGWPVLLAFDMAGWEEFMWPPAQVLPFLLLNALIGTNLSDALWAQALQFTSPLIATLGLSLTIPLGMVSDMLLHGKQFGPKYAGGAVLVLAGFFLGSVAEHVWDRLRCNSRRDSCCRQRGQMVECT
mmetsp:Transcript_61504/g.179762  ORF Transcript_61504/g.179762 Transcript_61504/m.179762 type:complete len:377 (-) Transcript_61504:7-1137(-)